MNRSEVRLVWFFECLGDLLARAPDRFDELPVTRVSAATLSITGGRCMGIGWYARA